MLMKSNLTMQDKEDKLKYLFEYLFGNKNEGLTSVISESRDITQKLSKILDSEDATQSLESERDINYAYGLINGSEKLIMNLAIDLKNTISKIDRLITEIENFTKQDDLIDKIKVIEKYINSIKNKLNESK